MGGRREARGACSQVEDPDLIAAAAEANGIPLLRDDEDDDRIAGISRPGSPMVAPRGSLS
jgi:hypothetical protein